MFVQGHPPCLATKCSSARSLDLVHVLDMDRRALFLVQTMSDSVQINVNFITDADYNL